MPHDVICMGEVMVELSLSNTQPDTAGVGYAGDTFNTAIYLKRRAPELSVAYATKLGQDPFTDRILSLMNRENLETDLVLRSPDRMPGLYAISTREDGERSFHYWRDNAAVRTLFALPALDLAALAGAKVFYLSAISLAILSQSDRDHLFSELAKLRSGGTQIVFDSNYRPRLWPDVATARREVERAWRLTDIGLPSVDDEQNLFGDATEAAVLARLTGWGVTDGALKRGAAGPLPLDGGAPTTCAPAPCVIDTTAAGDSFNGGYLAARLSGAEHSQAMIAGHKLASHVIQYKGAIIPRDRMGDLT